MRKLYFFNKIVLALAIVFAGTLQTKAQLLGWYFNAANGNSVVQGNEATVPARIVSADLETSELSRGSGLGQDPTYARSFFSKFPANSPATTRALAITNGTYMQFTLKPKTGKKASLTTLRYKLRTGGIGFGYQWAYSTDNWATNTLLGANYTTNTTLTGDNVNADGAFGPDVDLSGIAALQNITPDKTITFRLYIWGTHTVDRNFAIGRSLIPDPEAPDVALSVSGATTTLPVEMLSFDGASTLSGNKLDWVTASETNSKHFEILRSWDGEIFTSLGEVAAQGNSNIKTNYSFLDKNPANGINYYKLKQIDLDGKSEEYGPIAVKASIRNNLILNVRTKTSGEIQINTTSDVEDKQATLSISDIEGKHIYTTKIALTAGNNLININQRLEQKKVYLFVLKTKTSSIITKFIK